MLRGLGDLPGNVPGQAGRYGEPYASGLGAGRQADTSWR